MAKNCLNEKLKASTNNGSLPYLGYITLMINTNVGSYLEIDNKEAITVESIGGNHLSSTSGGEKTNIIDVPAHAYGGTRVNVYYDSGNYVIRISKKYVNHIRYIWTGGVSGLSCDISQFAYCIASPEVASSATLYIGSTGVYGNLAELSNIDLMATAIILTSTKVSGNIDGLAKTTRLASLNTKDTTINGSLEGLASGMVTNGRTSGTLAVTCNEYITLNGAVVGNNVTKTITFNSSLPNGYSIA